MQLQKEEIKKYKELFQNELNLCVDFWLRNGIDKTHGGVYTCLDRTGKIYSTDKSVWMQGRCAWTFARLCNLYGVKEDWLSASKSCIEFIDKYCIDSDGRMFFTVTEDGKPLRKRRYISSERFSIIAHAEYAKASGDQHALEIARKQFAFTDAIYRDPKNNDPYKITPKTIPETRSTRALGGSMIFVNVASIMRDCDPKNASYYDACIERYINDIFKYHWKPDQKMLLETVGTNGEFLDYCSAGRVINPGHDIEASWFLLSEAIEKNDTELAKKAEKIFCDAVEWGYDKTYGGLLYFVDAYHLPPEQYEHDMKLWWVHNEAIIASLMFYQYTKDVKYANLFRVFTDYAFRVFSDPEYGEWYGYLRRDGKPTEPACKGSTFKGPFHLPRMLMTVDQILSNMDN